MDPMAQISAIQAIQRQAVEWMNATKASLQAAGFGFDDATKAEIAAQAAAHPTPEGYVPGQPTAEDLAEAQEVARRAIAAEYPPNGFSPDDPRLQPVEGITLPMLAIAARAIGWSTDEAFTRRIVTALGIDPDAYQRASDQWAATARADVVLATLYGQLFINV